MSVGLWFENISTHLIYLFQSVFLNCTMLRVISQKWIPILYTSQIETNWQNNVKSLLQRGINSETYHARQTPSTLKWLSSFWSAVYPSTFWSVPTGLFSIAYHALPLLTFKGKCTYFLAYSVLSIWTQHIQFKCAAVHGKLTDNKEAELFVKRETPWLMVFQRCENQ